MVEMHTYRMSISLNVLNHLGIGLYSNIPAVLSEIVANAWDADASSVTIDLDLEKDEIVISDDGTGMTEEDINSRYLMVGYRKRDHEPTITAKGRAVMGRKGIGKLSVFSIANVVQVESIKGGQRNGFIMNADQIQEIIRDGKDHDYRPTPMAPNTIEILQGTRIILRELKRGLSTTKEYLRKRLARRFSIIGDEHDFLVAVNGEPISAKDRDFYNSIEFLWHMGNSDAEYAALIEECKGLRKEIGVSNCVDEDEGYFVKGWIGTVDEQKHIDEQNNTIVIFAHGKLVHEDLLKDLKEGGIYSKYIIGEIDADFMDLNEQADIVTSARQNVKEDDPRYKKLREYVRTILKSIQGQWTILRNDVGADRALEQPTVKEWYSHLKGDNQRYARQLFGKIESLKIPDATAKKELYKASLLAFEKMALKNSLSLLNSLETEKDFELVTKLFAGMDELEAAHYYQIVKGRIEIIREFERVLPDAKERLLQKHIFEHLWLLDPSWERASTNQRIEQTVTQEFAKIDAGLTPDELAGRIDIRYRTAAGKHIIVELKKYDRKVTVYELTAQVGKYRSALSKCLYTKFGERQPVIESICVVGPSPEPQDRPEEVNNLLAALNARYINYDTLIRQTLDSYQEYLAKEKEISALITIIDELDHSFV